MSVVKFSVSISYPPLTSTKGKPFLSQNRQFQWTNTDNIIYPVIPASAATLLHQNGYQVFWDDAIAQKLTYHQWLSQIIKNKPNLIAIETKTPVIKKHWKIINELKQKSLKTCPSGRRVENWKLKIVLMGDHVTALPQESLKNSSVDYVLTGGDYDFMLLNLANHLTKNTPLEPGFYFKGGNSGPLALKHHQLNLLPPIDRQLTQWQLYSHQNTNYKYKPGAYIMSGRDCWWGKCTFCSWTTLYPAGTFRTLSVNQVIADIKHLSQLGVKEIFDDAGTLPTGSWLNDFCRQMIKTKLNKKIRLSCNMRFGALSQAQYQLLAKAGFRMLLYGLESANQNTLNRLNKNTQVEWVLRDLAWAKQAGLEPHITIMVGYPWESRSDIQNTINLCHQIFAKNLADSLQATLVIPYPGTPLFKYCQTHQLLKTKNWNKYDMRQPVMKSSLSAREFQQIIQTLFKSVWHPKFIFHKITSIRSFTDFQFLTTYAVKFLKKLRDFS